MMRRGLNKKEVIIIIGLWGALCLLVFFYPSDYSIGEKIFIAIFSGIIFAIAIEKGKNSGFRKRKH